MPTMPETVVETLFAAMLLSFLLLMWATAWGVYRRSVEEREEREAKKAKRKAEPDPGPEAIKAEADEESAAYEEVEKTDGERVLWKIGDRVEVDLVPDGSIYTTGTIIDFHGEESSFEAIVKMDGAKEFVEGETDLDNVDKRLGIHDAINFRDLRKAPPSDVPNTVSTPSSDSPA